MGTGEINRVIIGEWGVCVCAHRYGHGRVVCVCVHAMVIGGGSGVWGKGCKGRGQGRLGRGHGSMPLGGRRKL